MPLRVGGRSAPLGSLLAARARRVGSVLAGLPGGVIGPGADQPGVLVRRAARHFEGPVISRGVPALVVCAGSARPHGVSHGVEGRRRCITPRPATVRRAARHCRARRSSLSYRTPLAGPQAGSCGLRSEAARHFSRPLRARRVPPGRALVI